MNNTRLLEELQDKSKAHFFHNQSKMEKVERYRWSKIGKAGSFQWISKKELKVDLSYQREPISEARVLKIAREFSWKIFGALTVAQSVDKKLYVTDGAHRLRATLLRGDIEKLPCMVFESKGQADEADQFVGMNTTSKGVSPYDRHRAELVAGYEHAIISEKIIKKHGYSFSKTGPGEYQTKAVQAVTQIVQRNADIADLTINILAEVADGMPIKNAEIKGLFYIISTNQSANIDWLGFPLRNLVEAGIGMIQSEITRTSMFRGKGGEKVFAEAIAEIINKGQIKNKVMLPV